jgi:membrane-bound lytic murein transglycosylase D
MDRKMERARLYLYYIVEEIEKRGMPMEIALLPAIESAYQPHAYSRARALGLWQFIAPTARKYGIEMNWWYDGRQDVFASTRAALDYLEKLYEEFNDWNLALAAYNAGEGRVHYAIDYNRRKGRPTDYQHLRLRAETLHYVPKLMALVNIVSNPQAYGIKLASIPNEPYFVPVDIGSQIDLNVVAELADVPVGDLYDINPGFKRWATAPDGPHRILVPIDKKEQLIDGLNNLPDGSRIKWRRHRVRSGDTLSTIARHYGVTISAITRANHLRGTLIRVGQNLLIPVSTRPLSLQVANVTRPAGVSYTPPASQAKVVHQVRNGETLWSIARQYRVYVNQLAKWNFIHPQDILRTGQTLNIWISP